MIFDKPTFDRLREIVFRTDAAGRPTYPGYKPSVVEAPNGDGKLDRDKRYAHVATKYLNAWGSPARMSPLDAEHWWFLKLKLNRCHAEAVRVHAALGLPDEWRPDLDASALRILEYPPGATSARHTDFDLFTLVAYRDPYPGGLVRYGRQEGGIEWSWRECDDVSHGLHFGELYELGGFGAATPHEVRALPDRECAPDGDGWQYSAVYFALPRHDLVLPDGRKVGPQTEPGTYLHDRMSRSRVNPLQDFYDRNSRVQGDPLKIRQRLRGSNRNR